MKCNKCGFISFDYLSECRGCGADISAVRDELGFLPVKPDLPFFLNFLVKAPKVKMPEINLPEAGDPYDSSLPEIEFGDDAEVDSTPGRDGGAALQTSPARVSMEDFGAGHMDGLSVDLDFEPESDGKIVPAAAAGSPLEAAVQDLSREELNRIMADLEANVPAGPSQSVKVKGGDLDMDLSEHDLANLLEQLEDAPEDAPRKPVAGKSGVKNP
jgi:hypothetical protein